MAATCRYLPHGTTIVRLYILRKDRRQSPMKIEYQVSSQDIRSGYFYLLKHSPRYRRSIALYSVLFFSLPLLLGLGLSGQIQTYHLVEAIVFGSGFWLLIPFASRLLSGKGYKKIAIDETGIQVDVGRQSKKLNWKSVGEVQASEEHIYIVARTANFMCIPKQQIDKPEIAEAFFELAKQYHQAIVEK